jgi:hypothetical protein
MKRFVFILIALVAATGSSFAQKLIAVQNGGEPTFFTELPAAITAASSGDTINIPGGTWNASSYNHFIINKTLHIIGTGHNPASSQVGGICKLNGDILIAEGSGNGSLTGVLVTGYISYSGYPTTKVSNYSLTRCRINGTVTLSYNFTQFVISENVFDDKIYGGDATDNIFSNNIFAGWVGDFSNNNMFKNNIMMSTTSSSANNFSLCFFDNNVIFAGTKLGATECIFNNNLFVDSGPFPLGTTNQDFKNIISQAQSSIFVTQSGNTFNYTQDYHLQATCPGKNAGKEGTDIGIYGGTFPWKEGSIPFNPHFQQVQVSPNTDANGNLNVNIKVEAQER